MTTQQIKAAPGIQIVSRMRDLIRDVPDFPEKGIVFRDVTPLLADPRALGEVTEWFAEGVRGERIDAIVAIESRGFLFGAPLAVRLGVGIVPVRKPGKLPVVADRESYALEYGKATLELPAGTLRKGQRVLLVDDVLATGGTARAVLDLIRRQGCQPIAAAFLIELEALGGQKKLDPVSTTALLRL